VSCGEGADCDGESGAVALRLVFDVLSVLFVPVTAGAGLVLLFVLFVLLAPLPPLRMVSQAVRARAATAATPAVRIALRMMRSPVGTAKAPSAASTARRRAPFPAGLNW
jgi:hypothetical protein